MKRKKKSPQIRIVKKSSVNYTFIEHIAIQPSTRKDSDTKKRENRFVRNVVKDDTTTKTHYKSNSRSPKSQQNHSPVYE
jgi:Tfp pilus assembly major pilin PilA